MAAEGNLRRRVTRWLRGQPDVWFVPVTGGMRQRKGTPDLLLCVAGRFLAVELKAPGKDPTRLQRVTLADIAAAGGCAIVARSLADVQEIVDRIRDEETDGT